MGRRAVYFPLPNLEERAFSVSVILVSSFALLSSSCQMVRGEKNGGGGKRELSLWKCETRMLICVSN